jgi:Polyphosphate kinase 2 (PPK2)
MKAYEEMLPANSQNNAPWFVIPADDKWFARVAIAAIIYKEFEKMKFSYPVIGKEGRDALQKAKQKLLAEKG